MTINITKSDTIRSYFHKRVQELKHLSRDRFRPLEDYTFEICKLGRPIGQCHYGKVGIYLNIDLVEKLTDEEWKDTINHEIAHALLGPGYGHSAEWRRMAVACDAKPRARTTLESSKEEWIENGKTKKYKVFNKITREFLCFSDTEVKPGAWMSGKKRQTQGKLISVLNHDGKPEWTEIANPEETVEPTVVETKAVETKAVEPKKTGTGRKPTAKAAAIYETIKTLPEFIAAALEVGMKESTAKIQFYAAKKYFG